MNYLWVDWLLLKIALAGRAIKNLRDAPMLRQLFRSAANDEFRARSPARDVDTDDEAVRSIATAINLVLEKAEAERTALTGRIDGVLSQAAVVSGFDVDDVLTLTEDRAKTLKESDAEIRRERERLRAVERNISHFKFLKAALQTRFPDTKI